MDKRLKFLWLSVLNWFTEDKKPEPIDFNSTAITDVLILGREAEDLLKNPAFIASVNIYEDELMQAWRDPKPMMTDARESIWHRIQALDEIKVRMNGMVNRMIIEKNRIEQEKSKGDSQ